MAENVVGFLLNQLSTLLQQESTLLGGLQLEVQFIRDELGSMRAFLRYAEAIENVPELQEWVRQVREVAYDIEDVLDEFLLRFSHRHANGFYERVQKIYSSIKNLRARHEISDKIKNIKSRVTDISGRHQRYVLEYGDSKIGGSTSSATGENVLQDIRGNALLVEEAKLVGIDEPKGELISQLLTSNSSLKVISVVGMGGMGKTTLVKRVYENPEVKKHFQSHAWLTLSKTFNLKMIIKYLIQQLFEEIKQPIPQQVESMDNDKLRAFIKDFLRDRRYIIVLDDIWSIESWDTIRYALPDANCGSRIMLSTRIADIASATCINSQDYVHEIKPLSVEESWTLFCDRTFGNNCCPPHLEDVSKRILRKCEGLPLAIISIGGVLAPKKNSKLDDWERVLRNLGGEMEGSGKLDRVKKILLLSYNDLPFFLKNCLLYVSIYPEDFKIDVDSLIRLWIAEGLVLEREGMSILEVAKEYLHELINKSLIQVADTHIDGSVKSCRIHDILREMILTKSREQNFVSVANRGEYTRMPDNIRRLAIYGFTENHQEQYKHFKHLRSLVIFSSDMNFLLSKLLSDGLKLLKVMHLSGSELESIPKQVFKLFHLKHLDLSATEVKTLPPSIAKLKNLEHLILINTNVTELAAAILKLKKLREVQIYYRGEYSENYATRGFRAPGEIGRLHSLEVLNIIDADNEIIVKDIGKLTKLRELGISKLRRKDGKKLCSSLGKLNNLKTLRVYSIQEAGGKDILDLQHPISPIPQFLEVLNLIGRLEMVPRWVPSLQGLCYITLEGSGLGEDPLECLQDLPNLVSIDLYMAYEGEELCFKANGFRKLKELFIAKLHQLKKVIVEKNALPCLQVLEITDCKLVHELPWGIQDLNNLQFLRLFNISEELMVKLHDKGSEEYRKVTKITQIEVSNWTNGKWEMCFL